MDEYGRKFSYKCPVPECPRSISKAKPVGFKEWAIHAGVTHHLVEKVMEEEAVKTPAMKEVLAEVARVHAERVGAGQPTAALQRRDPQLPPLRRQRQGWVESLAGPSEALAGKGVQ